MFRRCVLLIAALFLFVPLLQAAQVPRSEKEIPIYPGAVKDQSAEDEIRAEEEDLLQVPLDDDEEHPMVVRSFAAAVYMVGAPAEKVLLFYLGKLGGKEAEDGAEELYEGKTSPGETSQVFYQLEYVDLSPDNQEVTAELKSQLQKARVPLASGNWIASADFAWEAGETNGDVSNFDLIVRDEFFNSVNGQGRKQVQTSIVVRRTTYMNPADARATLRKLREERKAEGGSDRNAVAIAPFNPVGIGIALYPGSVYDEETSSFLQETMGLRAAAYQCNDEVRTISAFFAKAGLKQVQSDDSGVVMKRCRNTPRPGQTLDSDGCDVEITIQKPWMDMERGELRPNTLIAIVDYSQQ
jgi:hypothetical protein